MLLKSFAISILLVHAHAIDLTCLTWDVVLLPAGLFCHFKRNDFNAVENATANAVTQAANDAYDVGKFEVKHHPVYLAYDYAKTTAASGTTAANQQLGQQVKDVLNLDIGFGKEGVNTAVTIVELSFWADFNYCLISGIANLAPASTSQDVGTARKRAVQPSQASARDVLTQCASNKFRQIASPAVFDNITDPNQKVGKTLATYASFLIPLGGEEIAAADVAAEVADEAAVGAYDLSLPGSEDTTRFISKTTDGVSTHLQPDDWPKLKKSLENNDYFNEKCIPCAAPLPITSKHRRDRLDRRVGALGINAQYYCCDLLEEAAGISSGFDTPDPNTASTSEAAPEQVVAVYDTRSKYYDNVIPEDAVISGSKVPSFESHVDVIASSQDILNDLDRTDTAVLQWSPDVLKQYSSKDVFKLLRRIFKPTTGEDKALNKILRARNVFNAKRIGFNSLTWSSLPNDNAELNRLKAFADAIQEQAKQTTKVLRGLSDDEAAELTSNTDFYYIPEGEGLTNPDPRGSHRDGGMLQLGAADQPGLIIEQGDTLTRVPNVDNGWHLIKCSDWTERKVMVGATRHTVFGPEIVQYGRVSMIVNVFRGFL